MRVARWVISYSTECIPSMAWLSEGSLLRKIRMNENKLRGTRPDFATTLISSQKRAKTLRPMSLTGDDVATSRLSIGPMYHSANCCRFASYVPAGTCTRISSKNGNVMRRLVNLVCHEATSVSTIVTMSAVVSTISVASAKIGFHLSSSSAASVVSRLANWVRTASSRNPTSSDNVDASPT